MRLSRASRYALHAVAFLAAREGNPLATSSEIAGAAGLPVRFLQRALGRLVRAGEMALSPQQQAERYGATPRPARQCLGASRTTADPNQSRPSGPMKNAPGGNACSARLRRCRPERRGLRVTAWDSSGSGRGRWESKGAPAGGPRGDRPTASSGKARPAAAVAGSRSSGQRTGAY